MIIMMQKPEGQTAKANNNPIACNAFGLPE